MGLKRIKKDEKTGDEKEIGMGLKGIGLIAFDVIPEVFKTEKILRGAGFDVKAALPPQELRKGCDLAVEFPIMEKLAIERILKERKLKYIDIMSLDAPGLKPLELIKRTDFDDSVMIRSGSMKISIDKESGEIRNISGGGCPDIPHLCLQIVGKKITEAPHPKDIGRTLCAYLLDRGFQEALRIYEEAS